MEKANDSSAANGVHDGDHQEDDPMVNMDEEEAAKTKLNADADPGKIKFTSVSMMDGKNGEAKVDIHLVQTSIGMGKEELMKYANDPFWIRLRLFLFILFWVGWIAMLVGAVVIILLAPRCPPPPKLEWYEKTAMYQVDVAAFKDSDEDGVGDIRGLISELDYFKKINVRTLLLEAFYSVAVGTGGIINHTEIDSKYGTMSDFTELVEEMKKRDMKIILDFVPNHSSNEHPWFKASLKNEEPYDDYYVWSAGAEKGRSKPPNNWLSVDGKSSWKWSDERSKYYLHTFSESEPDLNLRNEAVRNELETILRFWLDKGVDGFKIIAASHLIEDFGMKQSWDEPLITNKTVNNPSYSDLNHVYTVDFRDNVELFTEWRNILSNFSDENDMRKILLAELSGHINTTATYFGNASYPLIDFPINNMLTELQVNSTGEELKGYIERWTQHVPGYIWPSWLLGNKHTKRLASRVGTELIDGIHMVVGLMRGTPITYYGDELGLTDIVPPEINKPFPMPWNNNTVDSFITQLGISVPHEFQPIDIEVQQKDKQSHLNIFGKILNLRYQPAINFGLQEFPYVDENIFSMLRVRKGLPGYLVAVNMGNELANVNLKNASQFLPDTALLEIRSKNIVTGPLSVGDHPKVKLQSVPLDAKQGVVLSFVPQFKD